MGHPHLVRAFPLVGARRTSAIRKSRRSRATTHHPRRGGTGPWRSHLCSLRYSWLGGRLCAPVGSGSVAQLTASPNAPGHAKGQVRGGGGHAADEAGDGRREDGSCRLPCQVHSTPPHWGQVVGRACGVLALWWGGLLGEGSSTGLCPRADCVCLAGASTPHMTTPTASATPSSTSRTPSAPRSSRPGEHRAWHSPGLSGAGGQGERLSVSQQLPKCWGTALGLRVGARLTRAVPVPASQTLLLLLAV